MAITIDPLKSSFKDDFKANLFLEEYAERIDSLSLLKSAESPYEVEDLERQAKENVDRNTNFKVSDEVLLKNSLDSLKRSHEYELQALKREKEYAKTPWSDRITDDLAENSKSFLLNMINLCKEKILFIYTIKNKVLTTFNNSFVCFEDKFSDPANKNKVFKLDFVLYHADKIFEGALKFAKNYLDIPLNSPEAKNLVYTEYRKFLIQLATLRNEFNGYNVRDDKVTVCESDYPVCFCNAVSDAFNSYYKFTKIKNEDRKEYRCVPYDIFSEKFRNCKKAVSKLINEITDFIEDSQENTIKILDNINKINGNIEKGKNAIMKIRDTFNKLDFMTTYYLKNLYDLCDNIFDSLNKTEILHRK